MSRSIAFILLMLFASACDKAKEKENVLRPVCFALAEEAPKQRIGRFSGVTQAAYESKLSFRVAGSIRSVAVKVGDHVKAGQFLMNLDKENYELQLQEAEAALARSEAEGRHASASYERIRNLYENRNASRSDLDAARAAAESAEAAILAMQKRLELAELQLQYTSLHAPVDADVAELFVEGSENVRAGQVCLLLSGSTQSEVKVMIPEAYIGKIEENDVVLVRFDVFPHKSFRAYVREVGIRFGALQTAFPVTVRLMENDRSIRPGMSAELAFTFDMGYRDDAVFVPPKSVIQEEGACYVYVIQEGAGNVTVERRQVKIGELNSTGLEVLSGLDLGEKVVTAGIAQLYDGMKVKLL